MKSAIFLSAIFLSGMTYTGIDVMKYSTSTPVSISPEKLNYTQLADVGYDTNLIRGRQLYDTEPEKLLEIFGGHYKKVHDNTLSIDCSQKKLKSEPPIFNKHISMTAFLLDLNSAELSTVPNIQSYRKQCSSKIVLTAGHAIEFSKYSGQCIVYRPEFPDIHQIVNTGNQIRRSRFYLPEYKNRTVKNSIDDYGFVKLDSPISYNNSKGLRICSANEVEANSCKSGTKNLTLSQKFTPKLGKLAYSDKCCFDSEERPYNELIAHKCEAANGASGGPLVNVSNPAEPCVLGIHVSADTTSLHNYASSLSNLNLRRELQLFLKDNCSP